ncbi:BPM1 [Symbiodinium pilosum]|uniref:BPM1 protein n=1 Tax=Symbiodinium pilosum TaxID=2952 RepID=A0A812NQ23_SYMPI|nr:BPM1 [Symbiodinium pilosum]
MAAPSTTAEALRADIEEAKRKIQEKGAKLLEAKRELSEAVERQRLRRALDAQRSVLAQSSVSLTDCKSRRFLVDRDLEGPHLPCDEFNTRSSLTGHPPRTSLTETENFAERVAEGEYVWKMEGFSWLEGLLQQEERDTWESRDFCVGSQEFMLVYNPYGGEVHGSQHGSLALLYKSKNKIAFRYRLFVKAKSGEFVQWGETGHECNRCSDDWRAYGPDVHEAGCRRGKPNVGIFGLSHKQLLKSEWVENGALTVKCSLEVRPEGIPSFSDTCKANPSVEVTGPSLSRDMRILWEKGTCSDVQFMIQGEVINAHSPVLCARSEVFEAQLTTGMKESVSKVIEITDCDLATFKAFLQFIYTDNLASADELCSSTNEDDDSTSKLSRVQALLAVSHKYQVVRLQLWCEMQLCKELTASAVCGILCQAHLHQAKELEKACLNYIKDNMAEVVKMPSYAETLSAWPQVLMKVSLFSAGVPEVEAAAAVDALTGGHVAGKRKREPEE